MIEKWASVSLTSVKSKVVLWRRSHKILLGVRELDTRSKPSLWLDLLTGRSWNTWLVGKSNII